MDSMKEFLVVTICGSMRYYNQMLALANELTLEGKIVLLPFVLKVDDPGQDADLQRMHRAKIDMSDEVYIFAPGRMGLSTGEEYKYAQEQEKQIFLYATDAFPAIGFQNDWIKKQGGGEIIATATASKGTELRKKLQVQSPDAMLSFLNLLIYGDPGVGKTYLAGTAEDSEDTSPVLFLDVEGGTTTLRKRKSLDVVPVRSIKQLTEIHNDVYKDPNYYKTVVIDSLTELQALDMRDIMRELIERRPDLDPDVPSQREWGKSRERMRKIVRAFRDLPCNTIMTALEATDKDDNNVVTHYPSFPGKLKSEIPGFMDVVGYLYATVEREETIRRIQFAKTRRIVAKDRTDALGDMIESPTIPTIWERISS